MMRLTITQRQIEAIANALESYHETLLQSRGQYMGDRDFYTDELEATEEALALFRAYNIADER